MPINATEYLRELATRIRKVPVCHGVDGYDIDALREVSQGIAELEKANVAYVDANTGLIRENKELRQKLFPYADATEISGISWDGKYLIGDKKSISYFHEMKNRGEQIDVYKRAYDQNIAAKDAEIAKLREALTEWRPIETAPKDGTLIILHDSVRVASGVGRWRQVSSRDTLKDIDGLAQFSRQYGWRSASDKSIENATHWMPLPDAPKGGAA